MSEVILQINNLSKHFKSTKAVDGIDLTIRKGEIFGILGPNGSGKTTILSLLAKHFGWDYSYLATPTKNKLLKYYL